MERPSSDSPAGVSPDDLLPPIEPPSATFLVQLFVLPAVIVTAIVCVWLMFGWVVSRTSHQPEDLIRGLDGPSATRWQHASELADMLRSEKYPEFRRSAAAATQLAELLEREISTGTSRGGMDESAINLRYFLCRALGQFEVAEGLPTLIEAASTARSAQEENVRRGAIQAIAIRTYTLLHAAPPIDFEIQPIEAALVELADDPSPLIRSEVAFSLGRIGTPTCLKQLEILVNDSYPDTRYNAAVALADHGHLAALETLAEMLDPENPINIEGESSADAQRIKRAVIIKNALKGVGSLAAHHPTGEFSEVARVLEQMVALSPEQLRAARIDPILVTAAGQTLEQLEGK